MVLCWSWKHRLIKIRNNVLSEIVSSHCATHFPCLEFNNLLFWPCFCRHTFENNFSNQNSINIKKTQFLWLLNFFHGLRGGLWYNLYSSPIYLQSESNNIEHFACDFLWKGIPYIAFPWATKKFHPSFYWYFYDAHLFGHRNSSLNG